MQSNHKNPFYLDGRVEAFLKTYREELLPNFSDEMISTQVQAVCDKLVEQPKNINEQARQLWGEIKTNTYLFERKQLLKAALQSLPVSVAFIGSFLDRFVCKAKARAGATPQPPQRTKVSSQFYGKDFARFRDSGDAGEKTVVINDPAVFKKQMALQPLKIFEV